MDKSLYNRRLSIEIIAEEIKGYGVQVISDNYISNTTPLDLKCKCGETFKRKYNKFKRDGYLCNKCKKNIRIEKELDVLFNHFQDLKCTWISHKEYKGIQTLFTFQCPCGNVEEKKLVYIIENPSCKECIRKRINEDNNFTNEEVKRIIEDNSDCILLSTDYINRNSKITLKCACSNVFTTYLPRFQYEDKKQCNPCGRLKVTGENSYRWKGGITSETQKLRHSKEYIHWRKSIFERDNFTCQCCLDSKGGNLHAHHILNFSDYDELRFDIANAVTLCNECHNPSVKGSFHHMYGTRNNTLEQLQEYFDMKRTELNLPLVSIKEIIYNPINKETEELQTN